MQNLLKMKYYFKVMNYRWSDSLQRLTWINSLWDWIQEVGIQLGILLKRIVWGRGRRFWLQFLSLFQALPLNGWSGLEFIEECRVLWSDELAGICFVSRRELWVLSSCFESCLLYFESCRALNQLWVLSARNLLYFESLSRNLVSFCMNDEQYENSMNDRSGTGLEAEYPVRGSVLLPRDSS